MCKKEESKKEEIRNTWYTCGKCKKNYEHHADRAMVIKVTLAGFADILCYKCRAELDAEIYLLAKKFLSN